MVEPPPALLNDEYAHVDIPGRRPTCVRGWSDK